MPMRSTILFRWLLVLALLGGCSDEVEAPPSSSPSNGITARDLSFRGKRIHLLMAGPSTASRTVLLLHGARYDSATWKALGTLDRLAERGFRVLALDLPGHGGSEQNGIAPQALLAELLPMLARDHPVLVTPSMSGRYVFPYLANHAADVAGFVALAPVGVQQYEQVLEQIRLPTLILWGAEDRVVPVALAEMLHRVIAGSVLQILPGAGHACYLDQPDPFHRLLIEFLDGLNP